MKKGWSKPSDGFVKCNVGPSWINGRRQCGESWILRDPPGTAILQSRRAYSFIGSKEEADLYALLWAIDSMRNLRKHDVIFESSSIEMREVLLFASPFGKSLCNNREVTKTWSFSPAVKTGCIDKIKCIDSNNYNILYNNFCVTLFGIDNLNIEFSNVYIS